MAKPFGVWGIDVGQCALKAIRLEMIDGKPTATAFDYIEHTKILSQPDADPDAPAQRTVCQPVIHTLDTSNTQTNTQRRHQHRTAPSLQTTLRQRHSIMLHLSSLNPKPPPP